MADRPLVLYHGNCPDGFTAAWAVWRALGDAAEYRAVNYGTAPPYADAKGRRVILVDFSFPRAALDTLAAAAESIEIYDHHKTAEADLAGWAAEGPDRRVVFDMNRSGCGIAWDEFHPDEPRAARARTLVDYVEDRDLWRFSLPMSREAGEYVFSWPRDFETWNAVAYEFEHHLADVLKQGAALMRAKRARVEQIARHARPMSFDGTTIYVVNTAWDFSDIGEYIAQKHGGVGGYYFDRDDHQRQWGFRSIGDFDVSALCTKYGGGGHRNAAGFQSEIGWLPT